MKTSKAWTFNLDTYNGTWIIHDPAKPKLYKSNDGLKYTSSEVARTTDPDLAAHIVACVNSCFGLNTQELMEFDKDWRDRLENLQKTSQRAS